MGAGYTGDLNASRAAAASGARLARRGQEAGEAGIRVVEGQDLPEVVAGVGQRPGAVLTHADAVTPAVTAHQQPPLHPEAHRLQAPTPRLLAQQRATEK